MNSQYSPRTLIEREGGQIVPGSGGRHRQPAEPRLITLAARAVRDGLRRTARP
ncbi:MAG: hypothetical protein ACRDSH_19765 [Pseudonocardiaceae bacterium]